MAISWSLTAVRVLRMTWAHPFALELIYEGSFFPGFEKDHVSWEE